MPTAGGGCESTYMSTTVAAAVVPISYRRPIFRRRVGPGRSARGGDGASRLAAAADTEQAGLDDAVAKLLSWAESDSLRLSDKVTVGAAYPGGPRGLLATRDIEQGEEVISLPTSCTAFDADYASADEIFGLRDAIAAYESSPSRGGDVTPEVSLALLIALARRHPERTPFGPYAAALPADPPPSPIFFPDEKLEALLPYLPLSLVDDIDAARQEMYTLWDVATAVMERVKVDGEPAAALGVDEFAWAWMMIRSRAVTFRVRRAEGGGDGVDARRCMVPVVDIMNHECSPVKDRWRNAPFHRGPAVELEAGDGAVTWRATREIDAWEEVSWTYGNLSNEALWLWYGFVPEPPSHGGCVVSFQLRESSLRGGLASVAKGDSAESAVAREDLLVRCGAFDARNGGGTERGTERELHFEVKVGERPKVLAGIAGLMCCSEEEVLAMKRALMSFGGCVMDEEEEEDEGAVAFVDMSGRLKVRLCQESRRRAGRYVAFILDQVEPMACGPSGDDLLSLDTVKPDAVDADAWWATVRLRTAAKEVFAITNVTLEEEAIKRDGGWIDEAVASILNIY